MTIHIEDLKFQTIIGILDFERTTPQDVIINLTIEYNYKDDFINYAEVSALIESIMIEKEFLLLEEALSTLALQLKKDFPKIEKLFLKITKPSIMPNCKVSLSENYSFNS